MINRVCTCESYTKKQTLFNVCYNRHMDCGDKKLLTVVLVFAENPDLLDLCWLYEERYGGTAVVAGRVAVGGSSVCCRDAIDEDTGVGTRACLDPRDVQALAAAA